MSSPAIPSDYWGLSRLAESVSSGLFLWRHEGPNEANKALLREGIELCIALERGMNVRDKYQQPISASDVHIAESLQRMLNNAACPPISRAFQDKVEQLGWAKNELERVEGAGNPIPDDHIAKLENFFSGLSLLLSRQMLTDYYANERLRATSVLAEPLLSM